MTPDSGGGITPALSAEDLIAAVPRLERVAAISARSPFRLPGASLTMDHLTRVAALISSAAAEGVKGAIVVQGTDTIEETAFVLDCLLATAIPVVVTGAMRGPEALSADGPANLMASALVATSPDAHGLGTLVVLNDEVHAARYVRKQHTGLLSAFSSAPFGPIGHVIEERFRKGMTPERAPRLPVQLPLGEIPPVALIEVGLGEDGRTLNFMADAGYRGVVLAAMGAGHVPVAMVEPITMLVRHMPVVLCSRVANGPVFHKTYGFEGSERDLRARGVLGGGELGPLKARLLLQLALLSGMSAEKTRELFLQLDHGA